MFLGGSVGCVYLLCMLCISDGMRWERLFNCIDFFIWCGFLVLACWFA